MTTLLKHPGSFTIAYLLIRMLLSPLSPVPGTVALDPLWIFAVFLHRDAGRGWMFSLIPGLVFGDWMCGMAAGQIALRLAGFVFLGSFVQAREFKREYLFLLSYHALFSSLVPEWSGQYPVAYLYGVWMLQGLLWFALAAPKPEEKTSVGTAFLIPLLGILALQLLFPSDPLWPLPRLGSRSGLVIRILAPLLLLPPLVTLLQNRNLPSSKSGGRWTHLAE